MAVAIRMGHMKNVDQGAVGLVNEYDVNRAYTPYIHKALQRSGIETLDCTPESAVSMNDSLCQGVDKANNSNCELFISCHVNAFSNSQANGSTVIYGSEWEKKLAQCILDELVGLGFTNRGVSPNDRGLYEIKATKMSTVIVEPFFCTNQNDTDIYNKVGAKGLGEAIAKGICKYLGVEYVPEKEENLNNSNPFLQVYNSKLEVHFNDYIGIINFDELIKKS